jgi:signal transduction histidine kinase
LRRKQTELEQSEKSKGRGPVQQNDTPAEQHAQLRLQAGFTISQLHSEYRALRASVLHLWGKSSKGVLTTNAEDIAGINEAIDQAVAESIARYSKHQNDSKNMFLGVLGHDLRNPLSTINMRSMILIRYKDIDHKVTAAAKRIFNSAQRMNRLITELMDYTRLQLDRDLPVVKTKTNLASICEDIIEEVLINQPECNLKYLPQGSFDGFLDKDRLAQVFSNLLGNAVQHGDSSEIGIALSSVKDAVTVKISNRGSPIPLGELDRIFDPLIQCNQGDQDKTLRQALA